MVIKMLNYGIALFEKQSTTEQKSPCALRNRGKSLNKGGVKTHVQGGETWGNLRHPKVR